MPRQLRCLALPALIVAALAAPTPAAAAAPAAEAAKRCDIGAGTGYGTTYVTSIRVSSTSCRSGKRVIKAYHACRPGRAGRCGHRVRGYRCNEGSRDKSPVQYDAKVVCRNGGNVVTHRYTQNI
jgi:hypothetical protein